MARRLLRWSPQRAERLACIVTLDETRAASSAAKTTTSKAGTREECTSAARNEAHVHGPCYLAAARPTRRTRPSTMFNLGNLVQKAQQFIEPTLNTIAAPASSDRRPSKATLFRYQFRLPDTQNPSRRSPPSSPCSPTIRRGAPATPRQTANVRRATTMSASCT